MSNTGLKRYEWMVSFIFFFAWGLTFLNRLSTNFAADTLIEEFSINNTQYSLLSSVFAITYAAASIFGGMLSDGLGMRKRLLAPMILAGGAISILGAFCQSFTQLLIVRGLTGLCVGSTMTLMMAILSVVSSEGKFGRNSGIMATGVSILANTLGPILVTQVISMFSWRACFILTGALMLAAGLVVLLYVKEVPVDRAAQNSDQKGHKSSFKELFTNRNFLISCLIGVFSMVGYWTTMIFAPLYMTNVMELSSTTMGYVVSALGIIFIPYALFVPTISDKIGRKPALLIAYLISMLSPLGMFIFSGSILSLVVYVIAGGMPGALPPIFSSIIPMESLPDHLKASGGGIVLGLGEILGGSLWPIIAGMISDRTGIPAVMGISALSFVVCILLCIVLKESNQRILKQKAGTSIKE